jgi:hypothetical protein
LLLCAQSCSPRRDRWRGGRSVTFFGTFVHPQDPLALEIQVAQLKGLVETYPQAEGIFFNFAELYPELANEKHRTFFEHERPRFHDLRQLSIPWGAALANIYDVKVDQLVDSNIGYFDLFSRLLQQASPGTRLGLMTIGRGYALPLFHKLLPETVSVRLSGVERVWTMLGMPMSLLGRHGTTGADHSAAG